MQVLCVILSSSKYFRDGYLSQKKCNGIRNTWTLIRAERANIFRYFIFFANHTFSTGCLYVWTKTSILILQEIVCFSHDRKCKLPNIYLSGFVYYYLLQKRSQVKSKNYRKHLMILGAMVCFFLVNHFFLNGCIFKTILFCRLCVCFIRKHVNIENVSTQRSNQS